MTQAPLPKKHAAPAPVAAEQTPLYLARKKVYPQSITGTFRRLKWAVLAITLVVYYLTPFLRWDRGPGAPDQAVLLDLQHRRFYFFFIEIWPDEVYLFSGLLILAALILFLMTSLAGRVWCGYLCPQTLWSDIYYAVERLVEGDRRDHMRRDQQPMSMDRAIRFTIKHILWILIALLTGGAWVLYFADAPTLLREIFTLKAPVTAYTWIGILTFTTYIFAGWMREQVCVYMCPWPRIQAALTDEYALNVTYRVDRGEPRASVKKATALRAQNLPAGDCIDCDQCVAVCPTGVDIRHGLQLGCIQCALCIDACNAVMDKVNRPRGLIGYDTDINVQRREAGEPTKYQLFRPRTLLYCGLITLVCGIMLTAMVTRSTLGLLVTHDRSPSYVNLSDGSIRNGYMIRISNRTQEEREVELFSEGVEDARLILVGGHHGKRSRHEAKDGKREDDDNIPVKSLTVDIKPDKVEEVRLLVFSSNPVPNGSAPLYLIIRDPKTGETKRVKDAFFSP